MSQLASFELHLSRGVTRALGGGVQIRKVMHGLGDGAGGFAASGAAGGALDEVQPHAPALAPIHNPWCPTMPTDLRSHPDPNPNPGMDDTSERLTHVLCALRSQQRRLAAELALSDALPGM